MLQTLSKSMKEMERGEMDSAGGNEKGRRERLLELEGRMNGGMRREGG